MGTRRTLLDRAEELARDQRTLARLRHNAMDPATAVQVRPKVRHCWVRQGDIAVEALLVDWIHSPTGWKAEVVFVDETSAVGMRIVAADDLRAAR